MRFDFLELRVASHLKSPEQEQRETYKSIELFLLSFQYLPEINTQTFCLPDSAFRTKDVSFTDVFLNQLPQLLRLFAGGSDVYGMFSFSESGVRSESDSCDASSCQIDNMKLKQLGRSCCT